VTGVRESVRAPGGRIRTGERRVTEGQDRAFEALGEIQRRGLQAAGALVERLVSTVDGLVPPSGAGDGGGGEEAAAAPDAVDDLVAGWAKLWRDSISGLASSLPVTAARAASLDVRAPAAPTALEVRLDGDGCGSVEVWVHNPSDEPYDELRLHCAPPVAHDGAALDPRSITPDPDAFALPPRSSRGIRLAVDAPGAHPGTYRSLVLVDGLPDQWLALEIHVPAARS
jgi:hypothetical protein